MGLFSVLKAKGDRLLALHFPEGVAEEASLHPRALEATLERLRGRRVVVLVEGMEELLEEVALLARGGHATSLRIQELLKEAELLDVAETNPALAAARGALKG